jgi:hypothetical protein
LIDEKIAMVKSAAGAVSRTDVLDALLDLRIGIVAIDGVQRFIAATENVMPDARGDSRRWRRRRRSVDRA